MRTLSRGNLKAARKTLRRNRGRSFLTMLGIIIGVASVISVVSIGQGVKQQVAKQIDHMGNDVLTIRAGKIDLQTTGLNRLSTNQISGTLGSRDVSVVRQAARGATVVPLSLVGGNVTAGSTVYKAGNVVSTSNDLPQLLNQGLAYGTFFDDNDSGTNVAVLGQAAAVKLFGTAVPLGQSFNFRGQNFTVRGVFTALATLGFLGFSLIAEPLLRPMAGGSAAYLPALAALMAIGGSMLARGHRQAGLVLGAGAVFTVSLAARMADAPFCGAWPLGTHFLWHILNATTLGLLLVAAIRQGARAPHRRITA